MRAINFQFLQKYVPPYVYDFLTEPTKTQRLASEMFILISLGFGIGIPLSYTLKARGLISPLENLIARIAVLCLGIMSLFLAFYLYGKSYYKNLEIDYDYLKPHLINKERLKKCETEIENGISTEFDKLIGLICDGSYVLIFQEGNLFPWFLSQLQRLIRKCNLPEDVSNKLYLVLSGAGIFDNDQEMATFHCQKNLKVKMSKIALLLASFNLRTLYHSNIIDANLETIELQRRPSLAATQLLKKIIHTNRLIINLNLSFIDVADFLYLYEFHEFPDFEKTRDQLLKHITAHVNTDEALEKTFKEINEVENSIGFDLANKLRNNALSSLFQHKYNDSISFDIEENCFGIPLDALHLLESKESNIGAYLSEKVNCISLPDQLTDWQIARMKLLREPQKITGLIIRFHCEKTEFRNMNIIAPNYHLQSKVSFYYASFEKLLEFLPIKTVYITATIISRDRVTIFSRDSVNRLVGAKLPEKMVCLFPGMFMKEKYNKNLKVLLNKEWNSIYLVSLEIALSYSAIKELFEQVKIVNITPETIFYDYHYDGTTLVDVDDAFNENQKELGLSCHFTLNDKADFPKYKATFTKTV